MNLNKTDLVVKTGTFLYDGTILCDLRIVRSEIIPGSGDYEDLPEVAEDQHGECYRVQYGSTTVKGHFNAASEVGITIDEAIATAEATPGIGKTIRWID